MRINQLKNEIEDLQLKIEQLNARNAKLDGEKKRMEESEAKSKAKYNEIVQTLQNKEEAF